MILLCLGEQALRLSQHAADFNHLLLGVGHTTFELGGLLERSDNSG